MHRKVATNVAALRHCVDLQATNEAKLRWKPLTLDDHRVAVCDNVCGSAGHESLTH